MTRITVVVLALLVMACGGRQTVYEDRGVALVIVNPANQSDASDLREILLGRHRHWRNGTQAVFVDVGANTPHRNALLERVVGLDSAEYERSVTSQMYTTSWRGPHKVANDEEVIRTVSGIKGAVGVISPGSLTDSDRATVRVLLRL